MASKKTAAKKRADTIAKRQQKLKEEVLKQLESIPIIEVATKKAGTSSSTYYRWMDEDSIFARAARESLDRGLRHLNDVAESKVVSGIYNNDKTFIIFWLKNRHKNYADKQHHIHQIPDDNPLTEERKQEIADAMRAWAEPETGDERDEDYVVDHDEPEDSRGYVEVVDDEDELPDESPPPVHVPRKGVAKMYVPKRK